MRTVKVALGPRSYTIHVGTGGIDQLGAACARLRLSKSCAVITDSNVGPLLAKKVNSTLHARGFTCSLVTIAAGETSKSLKTVGHCYDQLAAARLERKSFVLALGGGVVGDLAGFVAATYLRGVPFVQVPTTLLAQVDSSVGGKVGVNLKAGKNLVGAFYQPVLVICDLNTLDTLPVREYRAGLAEVIKYGIIYDSELFEVLESRMPAILQRQPSLVSGIVARCCEIKADVVRQDEKEGGLRAILNFGHTIGHGLEAISGYGKYLHGEAISIGQVAAARLSQELLGMPRSEVERIEHVFTAAGLPTKLRLSEQAVQKLKAAMLLDKKVASGELKFVLSPHIGKAVFGQRVPADLLERILRG